MPSTRRSGILLHPTSLPGPFGIGDLGAGAAQWLDYLAAARQSLWQVLPLGPTGYGDSPYQPFSAFAGTHLLIDPLALAEQGLLTPAELWEGTPLPQDRVDYGRVIAHKGALLRRSFERYQAQPPATLREALAAFEAAQRDWLEDYALFMALKRRFDWAPWVAWPRDIALRAPGAVQGWAQTLADDVAFQKYLQGLFDLQWQGVRAAARAARVEIIGDMPIFVGHDSADVWAHRGLFQLDGDGQPQVVAGVPPDYFSPTGQLWGNPHYRWERMRADGYAWWLARLRRVLSQVDIVRLDHFRGFSGYWEVPADEETAIHGRWVRGPGADFFHAVGRALGKLPIIAEDLGLITPDVLALRRQFDLPGMRVLQFGFDSDGTNLHLPHNYEARSVVYTGTHDNDTTLGWYGDGQGAARHRARLYAGSDGRAMHWDMLRLVMASVAEVALAPLQDVLGLGGAARMNMPGRPDRNWTWRYRAEQLAPEVAAALAELTTVTGRWRDPAAPPPDEVAPIDYVAPFAEA
ncbi:MAG: 4-alpha-glucanotransferase [Chloroflexota bacterium]